MTTPSFCLNGPSRPAASGQTDSAVVFLHGYGADGNDLISLAPYFARQLPNTAFHAPDAPEECEISAFGRQWFSLNDYDPELLRRNPHTFADAMDTLYSGTAQAAERLNQYLGELCTAYQIGHQKLALIGFSQGSMMALHVALRHAEPIAGVVTFSGALTGASRLAAEITARPPVLLVHGEQDDILPVRALALAEDALTAAAVPHDALRRPRLGHGIDEVGVERAIAFLTPRLR